MRIVPRLRGGRRLPGGLALRIGLMVFLCALATSGVVTWVSVRSIEGFVRSRIDRQFPELLHTARERAALWYDQRELDLQVVAQSGILRRHAGDLAPGGGRSDRAREEVARYLRYVLDGLPQYAALVVLDREGRALLRVGEAPELPGPLRRELAGTTEVRLGPLRRVAGRGLQLASAPLGGRREEPAASVHAVVRLDALRDLLAGTDLPESAQLLLVDRSGRPVLEPPSGAVPDPSALDAAPEGEIAVVEGASGGRRVTSATPLGRFGWRLVVSEPYEAAFAPVSETVRRALAIDLLAVLLLSAAAFAVAAWRVRPLEELAKAARRLAGGEPEVAVPMPRGDDEIRTLARAFNDMASRLQEGRLELESRNAELQRANEVLEQLSITDGLTKLHNHRHFQDQFAHEARRAKRTGQPLCLILADVDDFKALNDRLGHSAGDRVLERVAAAMAGTLRETDYLARYGGEEFALLAPDTGTDGALALAEKLRTAVASCPLPFGPEAGPSHVTVSLGVAPYSGSTRATFDAADRALYEAKEAGKDCVVHAAL